MELNLTLRNLKPSMKRDEVGQTNFFVALVNLDALDWAFLQDGKLSAPFWEAVDANAPAFLRNGMKALAKKSTSQGVTAADIEKALSIKLNP
jgi:hypothetical protein